MAQVVTLQNRPVFESDKPFHLTKRQIQAQDRMGTDAVHTMLYGGSRSGKTFVLCKGLATRALNAPHSRHAIFRYRMNALRASIVADTWPKMMRLCYPKVKVHLNKQDWYYEFQNGAQVWLGGLDSKDRSEKVLGQEYATIFINECSQVPWASREIARTRLAQNIETEAGVPLNLRAWYDCNPPSKAHWTYKLFMRLMHPIERHPVIDPANYNHLIMNPDDNRENLPEAYINELMSMGKRDRQRFYEGLFGDAEEAALWTEELLDQQRWLEDVPDFARIVIGVDPSGCEGEEDERSDEIGIVVVGLTDIGQAYVLADLSGRYPPLGDNSWPAVVDGAFKRFGADRVIAEQNFGGAMVEAVLRAYNNDLPVKRIHASRGKVVRAEPISTLFEQQKVWMAGTEQQFDRLEEQLCAMTINGYTGDLSPDRADAMIWALYELFPSLIKKIQGEAGRRQPRVITSRPRVQRSRR